MSKYKHYLYDLGYEVKTEALEAVRARNVQPDGSNEEAYESGRVMAFQWMIALMQQSAKGMGIPLSDIRLDDIDPDRDVI